MGHSFIPGGYHVHSIKLVLDHALSTKRKTAFEILPSQNFSNKQTCSPLRLSPSWLSSPLLLLQPLPLPKRVMLSTSDGVAVATIGGRSLAARRPLRLWSPWSPRPLKRLPLLRTAPSRLTPSRPARTVLVA